MIKALAPAILENFQYVYRSYMTAGLSLPPRSHLHQRNASEGSVLILQDLRLLSAFLIEHPDIASHI